MKDCKLIKYVNDKYKTREMFTDMDLFMGIEQHIPPEFKSDELIKKHTYYKSNGYTEIGPIFVNLTNHNPDNYCIIDQDGSCQKLFLTF